MRADRLVALLLILQRRGHVTASEVATELEVSERTARRDLDALGTAGFPIYSTQGRNGGWQLLGGARTDLSGLNAAEARALFLVAGPASSATPAVKAGLRKLLHALPATLRDEAESASSALLVDPTRWGQKTRERPIPPWLDTLQTFVINGEQVMLGYRSPKDEQTVRVVHPLGIAAKSLNWYLVADTDAGMRTFRVDRVTSAQATGSPVVRPEDFDLPSAWKLITERAAQQYVVSLRARSDPAAVGQLRWLFGPGLRIGPTDAGGQVEIEIEAPELGVLVKKLAGFGALVEVIDPIEARTELARLGAELSVLYGS